MATTISTKFYIRTDKDTTPVYARNYNSSTLTIRDENGEYVPWSGTTSSFTFSVDSLPAQIFVQDFSKSSKHSIQYQGKVTSADDDVVLYYDEGAIWNGYQQVSHVYLGETCVYSLKNPKKGYFYLNIWDTSATVTINGSTYSSYYNKIYDSDRYYYQYPYPSINSSVLAGTQITWSIEKTGYQTQSGDFYLRGDTSVWKELTPGENYFTLEIIPTPEDAYVYFNNELNPDTDKKILVEYGTSVPWSVHSYNYDSSYGTYTVTQDTSLYIALSQDNYTFTITTQPNDASIYINNNYVGNGAYSALFAKGSFIQWAITASGYNPSTGYINRITQNETRYVELDKKVPTYTITFDPISPSDTTIKVTANGVETTLSGNTYSAKSGTTISYVASKLGYTSQSESFTITNSSTIAVNLTKETYTFQVVKPDDTNNEITITMRCQQYAGHTEWSTYTNNAISGIEYGWVVEWQANRPDYETITGTIIMYKDNTETIYLNRFIVSNSSLLFRIQPNVSSENLSLTVDGVGVPITYNDNSTYATAIYTAQVGNEIFLEISGEHYETIKSTNTLPYISGETETIDVSLTPNTYNIYFDVYGDDLTTESLFTSIETKINSDASVEWQGESTQKLDANASLYSVSAIYGSQFSYVIDSSYYANESSTFVISNNKKIETLLSRLYFTLTIDPTPSDASVYINNVETNDVQIKVGENYSYTVSKTGYISHSGNDIEYRKNLGSKTIYITLISSNNVELAFNRANPSTGMTIFYDVGNSANFSPVAKTLSGDTVNASIGQYVWYNATATNYFNESGYILMDMSKTQRISLVSYPAVKFVVSPSDATIVVKAVTTEIQIYPSSDGIYYLNPGYQDGTNRIYYTISKSGYTTISGAIQLKNGNLSVINKTLNVETYHKVIIFTDPWNCTVTAKDYSNNNAPLTVTQVDASTHTFQILYGHQPTITVSRPGWNTYTINGNMFVPVTSDITRTIELSCLYTTPLSFECHQSGYITLISVEDIPSTNRILKWRIQYADGTYGSYENLNMFLPESICQPIYVQKGQTIQFLTDGFIDDEFYYSSNENTYCYFRLSTDSSGTLGGDFHVFGNLMSLMYSSDYTYSNTTGSLHTNGWNFAKMFFNQTGLTSCRELLLSAAFPMKYSYYKLFYGCTNLKNGKLRIGGQTPKANTYDSMFFNCYNMTTAPIISPTTMDYGSFNYMFYNCSGISYIEAYFKSEAPNTSDTKDWLTGVSGAGTFKKSSNATWTNPTTRNGSTVPSGWTITTA